MSDKRIVINNSILYSFSSLLIKGFNFLLLPLYTYSMSADQYGVINLINSFKTVASLVISFSLYSAVTRFYVELYEDRGRLKDFIGTLVFFILLSGTSLLIIGISFKSIFTELIFESVSFYPIIFLTLISLIFISLHTLHQTIIQATQNGKKLSIVNITVFLLQASLTIYFIGVLRMESLGFVYSLLVTNIIYFVYMIYDLKKNNLITFTFKFNELKTALQYSIPLMPHDLSTQIANLTSRIFINKSASLASVGLYSVASQFGVVVDTIQFSVNRAFSPWFFKLMKSDSSNREKDVLNVSNILLYVYSIFFLIIGFFSQEAILLMTPPEYAEAWKIVPIIVVGYSLKSIYYFYVNVLLYYREASRKLFIATLSSSIIEVIFSAILITYIGMYGAAVSFLIGKIIMVTIVILISKEYKHDFQLKNMLNIILPALLFLFIGLIFSYTTHQNSILLYNFFYKLAIFSIYLIYIILKNRNVFMFYFKKIINFSK